VLALRLPSGLDTTAYRISARCRGEPGVQDEPRGLGADLWERLRSPIPKVGVQSQLCATLNFL